MTVNASDNVDVIDAIKRVKDGHAGKCEINMHGFSEDDESGLRILLKFKKFIKDSHLDIRFVSFNGTLPKLKDYLRKCNSTK